jgi:molybdate transport system regulatory protein
MAIKLRLRIDLTPTSAVGPGKIELLEHIEKTGSISAAGRAMDMSYRRAWLLVDELNRLFKGRVANAGPGGKAGGGARLTPFGRELVRRFRGMEETARGALAKDIAALRKALQARPARSRRRTTPDDPG